MRQRGLRWIGCAILLVLFLGMGSVASSAAAAVVVPASLELVDGNAANCFPTTGCADVRRYQQVFAASEFTGPILIREIRFRRDALTTSSFSHAFSNVAILLSTTSAGPDTLSSTFADNHGIDLTPVRTGPLTLASPSSSGDPAPFDIPLELDTPFLYDPSQGNLLLDWTNLGGENFGSLFYDGVNTPGDATSRVSAGPAASTVGTPDTQGLVVEFVGDRPMAVEILDATGDGTSALDFPRAPALDAAGNLLVAGRVSNNVFRVSPDGMINEILTASGDGSSSLDDPSTPVVDSDGHVFVAGRASNNLFRLSPHGTITEILDATGDGTSSLDGISDPVLDAAGNVFVAGLFSDNVFRVTAEGTITEILDATGDGASPLAGPNSLTVDAVGNIYVAGSPSDNVFRIAPDGVIDLIIDDTGDGTNALDGAQGLAVDAAGNVFVASTFNDFVFRVTPEGTITTILDATGDGTNALDGPDELVVDAAGNLIVGAILSGNLFRVGPGGTVTEILDAAGDGTSGFGGATSPAVDAAGNVFVGGVFSDNVFRIAPTGSITEILDFTGDGSSGFDDPAAPAVDAAGSVFTSGASSDNVFRLSFFDVSDDFDSAGSGIGWEGPWDAGAEYVQDFPVDLGRPQHVRSSAAAFRSLDPAVASRLNAADEVWIAFDIRLDRLKNTSEFAGLSLFSSSNAEVLFIGGVFDKVPWGVGTGASLATEPTVPAGAEWARLMVRLDFADSEIDFFVNGALEASGTDLPARDWASVRLASGANRAHLDRLYIGTTREGVEGTERPRYAAAEAGGLALLDARREKVVSGAKLGAFSNASGLATDGKRIFYADFNTAEIVATAPNGTQELFRWSGPSDPVGLTLVQGELAVLEPVIGSIDFYAPASGTFLRFINHLCVDGSDAEGLAYDGTLLWVSCRTELEALDPATGVLVDAIPNAAAACLGGRGITVSAPGELVELTLTCSTGDWFRVLAATGEVIDSGNNGLAMGGVTYLPEPGAAVGVWAGLALLASIARRQSKPESPSAARGRSAGAIGNSSSIRRRAVEA